MKTMSYMIYYFVLVHSSKFYPGAFPKKTKHSNVKHHNYDTANIRQTINYTLFQKMTSEK